MTERTIKIKELISGQVDMGTFGLVELELLAIEKEMEALRQPLVSGSSLPRLFVAENQEFVIEGQIFTWYFSKPELRQGIVLNRKGVIEPQIISVTKVAKNFR